MPRSRSSMRQIREILRLKWEAGLSERRIARSCGLSRPTVAKYVSRAAACGLGWPLPASLDDAQLERMLYPPRPPAASALRPEPDWPTVHRELKRKGVTPAAAVGRVQGGASEGVSVHGVLRAATGSGSASRIW